MTADTSLAGRLNAAASQAAIDQVIAALEHGLPADYVEFLGRHNGGEGFIGEHYLILWKIEELIPFNSDYRVEKYAPGIFLFGSNGGGEAFGFDMLSSGSPVIVMPFIGMERRYAIKVANTFTDLFRNLESSAELFCPPAN